MTAYVISFWWGPIFDKSHREVIIMGVIILYRQEFFYGRGHYSMGYHQGGHYFCKGSQYFLEKGSFFL